MKRQKIEEPKRLRPKGWEVTKESRFQQLGPVRVDAHVSRYRSCPHVSEWCYDIFRHGFDKSDDGRFVCGYTHKRPDALKLAEKYAQAALDGKPKPPKPADICSFMCTKCF